MFIARLLYSIMSHFTFHHITWHNRTFDLWKCQCTTNVQQISHHINKWCPNLAYVHKYWPIVLSVCQTIKIDVPIMWLNVSVRFVIHIMEWLYAWQPGTWNLNSKCTALQKLRLQVPGTHHINAKCLALQK